MLKINSKICQKMRKNLEVYIGVFKDHLNNKIQDLLK